MIHFDIKKKDEELNELEKKTMEDGFWNDQKESKKILSEIKSRKGKVTKYKTLSKEIDDVKELIDIIEIEQDESLEKEISSNIKKIGNELEKFELQTLLSGKYDSNNAILTLHPGAGGTESQDWAEMLYRMYTRWATKSGYEVKELDYLEGDEAGIKSVTFEVIGEYAYGYLKGEMGVHRLVRISPFDSGGRRHTSFASLEVIPEIDDDVDLYINPDDIKMDVYRASGE